MSFTEFLAFCEEKKIRFSLQGEELKVKAPANTLLPDVIEQLRQYKPELITLLKTNNNTKQSIADIERIDRQNDLLPSFGQEQLWLVDSLYNSQHAYHFTRVLTFKGQLNVDALKAAFNVVFQRHEILRTTFLEKNGTLFQQVSHSELFDIPLVDFSDLDNEAALKASKQVQEEYSQEKFMLDADCMLKLKLIRLSEAHYQLVVVLHHIASDGWSLGVLISEFTTLYHQYLKGEVLTLPELPIQYVDYAHWQRTELKQRCFDELLEYWQGRLAGCAELHSLPLDKSRPTMQSFNGRRIVKRVDSITTTALKSKAGEAGTTLFTVLESLFSLFISRYSGVDDVIIGTPVANRHHEKVEGLIGYFVNMVPIRHQIDGQLSFNEYLQKANQGGLDAFEHQQLPFDQLVSSTIRARSQSYNPLVQICFILQSNEIQELVLPDVSCGVDQLETLVTLFDLQLEVTEADGGLCFNWEYATDLFDAATIERMSNNFELLLSNALKQSDTPLGQLTFISPEELHQQLIGWNNTQADFPKDKCIHELFEAQVQANPDAIAVAYEDSQLTYGELNNKSNQLACYLINERGVKPDTLIGVCLDRSWEMIVAIMGILKAGGAYVPLDPNYPEARLVYMLEDSCLTTVLTQTSLKDTTPISDHQAIYLDSEEMLTQLQGYSTANVTVEGLTARHLAYVIYTSGSTGNPKGVTVEHLSANNYLSYSAENYCQDIAGSIVSTSLNFDATLTSIFSPLVCGKFVQLIPSGAAELEYLVNDILQTRQPLLFKVTPAHLELMAGFMQNALDNTLAHTFIVGGEELKLPTLAHWKTTLFPNAAFVNEFGPTEATVGCSVYEINASESIAQLKHNVPIGKPITNTQFYVLNDSILCPQGAAGELHIGGLGLARGYLNQPALTAEKFIANPFYDETNPNSSERLYKTGDLVRYLPDGNLEFLGRIDQQVKIRGFRIELGEIEQQLVSYSDINEAVVVALSNDEGDKRLVAYVTHDDAPQMLDESEESNALRTRLIDVLRHHLSQNLPDYMVPSAFVVLEQLPLTPNGKVDRKTLPAPDMSLQQKVYVAPTTDTEKLLCEIWQEVLGVEQVGITDNFFELGGHSLLVTRLVSEISNTLKIQLKLKAVFSTPTVAESAAFIDAINLNESIEACMQTAEIEEGEF